MPIPPSLSPEEVRERANRMSHNIHENYETLRSIVDRHEATIRKRWTKKTRTQRLKILLDAWPNMPVSHRPDFEAFRKESPQQRERGSQYKDAFKWPHINQDDLSQTKTLPLLINARGRHHPSAFAGVDGNAMHLGKVSMAVTPVFLNCYTMILNGVTSPDEYGELQSWDDHEDAFELSHNQKQYLPGEGLLVLEAQDRLLKFLVDCCKEILHDIPSDVLISDTFPVQPEPPLKSESESVGFESLAVMASEAPYRLPMQLNLAQIESLLEAKVSENEDHLWTLREDPSYFVQQLLELKEHRQEMLKDTSNQPHPTTKKGQEGLLWARVMGTLVVEAYLSLEVFSELHRQAKHLRSLQQKYSDTISPSGDLPNDYLAALLKFQYYLDQFSKGPLRQLKVAVVASPPMRKFYARQPNNDIRSSKIGVISRGVKMNQVEGNLTWLLRTLWEDGHQLFLARQTLVIDELDRLMRSGPQAKELVSGYVAHVIGDLSIISQCSRQLELYQPWARNFENSFLDFKDEIEDSFKQWGQPWARVMSVLEDRNLGAVANLAEPTPGKFAYPFGKRRTKANVEALRQAESNLDRVWAQVDRLTRSAMSDLNGTTIHRLFSEPRSLRRTPEWVEPAETKQKSEPEQDPNIPAIEAPFSPLFSNPSSTGAKEQPITRSAKSKIKTRGKAQTQEETSPGALDIAGLDLNDAQPTFSVDARALKVFRTLFFNPATTSTPGEVPWNDFLHAMLSTGFRANKLYGSIWHFSPTQADVERSIHFHEPHPKVKLPFEVARRYGRRLNRAYGWSGSMFVLKAK